MRISLFTSYNKQERIYLWGIIMIKTLFKHISKYYKDTFVLAIAGVAVGVLVGLVDAAFGLGLNACTAIRTKYFWYLIWFLPLGGVFIWFIYHQFGKSVANGMKMVFHVGLGKNTKLPIRMVPLAVIGTWTTHLFGGSAGREGVAVQIGAAVSNNVGRLVDKTIDIENSRKMFLITGMAAGFSGLFCTPLAAIFFALEVLVAGKLEYHALIPATVASISAAFTSRALGLRKFHINILETLNYHPSTYNAVFLLKLAAMGLCFGIVGSLFALILRYLRLKFAFRFSSPVKKVLIMGSVVAILMMIFHQGRYSGTGSNLVTLCFDGITDDIYAYDWILKMALTILTLSSGFIGGEVAPLFSIGSCLGYVLGPVFGFDPMFGAALGFASVFCSGSNTLLAAILVGVESFGYNMLPFFSVVCFVSFIFNFNNSIFTAQRVAFTHPVRHQRLKQRIAPKGNQRISIYIVVPASSNVSYILCIYRTYHWQLFTNAWQ